MSRSDPFASFKLHELGELQLEDYCANDLAVVNAARVSLNAQQHTMDEKGEGLIGFLMRERHGTPFEHGYFRFRVKAPIFIFREWHRHRVGHSYNEWSARYSQLAAEFYIPAFDDVVTQVGKPGAYEFTAAESRAARDFRSTLKNQCEEAYACYEWYLEQGVAKQQARLFLPVNTYSEMIWSVNPRSLMHFLGLRNSEQAQAEIRAYAEAAEEIFRRCMPVTHDEFLLNGRKAP